MVQINFARKEINCKLVYYGPGLSGKTTNLEMVHAKTPDAHKGELTSISTDGDRTLFFDFMPLDLGEIAGMKTKFHLYTVPGQVYYNSTRKLVLLGADGVIFVADSSRAKLEDNKVSLDNLRENLAEMGKEFGKFPIVFQWNKRDMPDAMSPEELAKELNVVGAPAFEGIASRGEGVFQTLKALSKIVLASINSTDGGMSQGPDPVKAPAAKSAPAAKPAAPAAPAQKPAAPATPAPAAAASGGLQIERNNIGSGVKPAATSAASAAPPAARPEARPSMVAAAKAPAAAGGLSIERNETPPPAAPSTSRPAPVQAQAASAAPRAPEPTRSAPSATVEAPRQSDAGSTPDVSDLMKKTMSASDARSNARMDDVFRREVKVIGGKLGPTGASSSNKNSAVVAVIAVVAVALGAALAFFFLK